MNWTKPVRVLGSMLALSALLAACGLYSDEEILEGERVKIRNSQNQPGQIYSGPTPPIPEVRRNADWTQTNGVASHASGNLAGPTSPSAAWRADAGSGSADEITSPPIILSGRIFTLDAAAQLSAFDAGTGSTVWRTELQPEGEDGADGFGGGLASEAGTIYATTGFGEVLAVSAASGEILWRYRAAAPFRAAPAVERGTVVAVTRDNRAIGLSARTGELVWRVDGISGEAGLLGGASPAMQGRLAVLPFASGEVIAVDATSGRTLWSAVLGGARRGLARAAIADVTGDPVIIGRIVVAANQSGRIVAIDGRSGQRGWTRSIGSTGPIWAAGNSVYLVSDDAALVHLVAQTGQTVWRTPLPAFEDEEDREDPIAYSGPVMVNGRLWVTSSLGKMLGFDAGSGSEVAEIDLSSGTTTGPAVANGVMYVLSEDGNLQAFR